MQPERSSKRRFYYGWVIVAVCALAFFVSGSTAPPIISMFMTPMTAEFGWSRALVSGAVSLGTLVTGVFIPFIGPLFDRYGSRLLAALGAIGIGACLTYLAIVSETTGLYVALGLNRSIGMAIVNVGLTTAVANWFIRRRGRAIAWANLGRSAGTTVWPLVVYTVMARWNWRVAWLVMGIAAWVLLVPPTALLLRRRPEDIGLLPDGDPPWAGSSPSVGDAPRAETRYAPADVNWSAREAMGTTALWLLAFADFVRSIAAPGVGTHFMPYLLGKGIDPAVSAVVLSLESAMLGLGGLIWGFLAERFNSRYCLAASMATAVLGVVVLLVAEGNVMAFSYAIINGTALGGIFTLEIVIVADYFGRMSLGAIRGVVMPFQTVGAAIGPLAAGACYDALGSYQLAFVVFGVGYALSCLGVMLARPPRRRL